MPERLPKNTCDTHLHIFGPAKAYPAANPNALYTPPQDCTFATVRELHDAMLAFAIARRWPGVLSNALEPGWVATKMGGAGAPDDLAAGPTTQVWLAVSDDPAATVTGGYFYHLKPRAASAAAHDQTLQERLLAECERLSGIALPQ